MASSISLPATRTDREYTIPDKRDDRDVGCAAADVDDHVPGRLGDRKPRADGRHHRLFHEVHFARFSAIGGVDDGAFFHLRDFARHADNDAGMDEHFAAVRLLNEVIQHALGHLKVGNNAVLHGSDRDDVAGRSADHVLCFPADCFDFTVRFIDRYDRGLVDNDALSLGEDERVCGPKIDGEVREERTRRASGDSSKGVRRRRDGGVYRTLQSTIAPSPSIQDSTDFFCFQQRSELRSARASHRSGRFAAVFRGLRPIRFVPNATSGHVECTRRSDLPPGPG